MSDVSGFDWRRTRACIEKDPEAVHETDHLNRTALHLASWAGQLPDVEALIEAGAKVSASAQDSTLPLHFASQNRWAHGGLQGSAEGQGPGQRPRQRPRHQALRHAAAPLLLKGHVVPFFSHVVPFFHTSAAEGIAGRLATPGVASPESGPGSIQPFPGRNRQNTAPRWVLTQP